MTEPRVVELSVSVLPSPIQCVRASWLSLTEIEWISDSGCEKVTEAGLRRGPPALLAHSEMKPSGIKTAPLRHGNRLTISLRHPWR